MRLSKREQVHGIRAFFVKIAYKLVQQCNCCRPRGMRRIPPRTECKYLHSTKTSLVLLAHLFASMSQGHYEQEHSSTCCLRTCSMRSRSTAVLEWYAWLLQSSNMKHNLHRSLQTSGTQAEAWILVQLYEICRAPQQTKWLGTAMRSIMQTAITEILQDSIITVCLAVLQQTKIYTSSLRMTLQQCCVEEVLRSALITAQPRDILGFAFMYCACAAAQA